MPGKTKILHIVEALEGGVYTYFMELTRVMGQRGDIDVSVIYNDRRSHIDPERVRGDFHNNVRLYRIPMSAKALSRSDIKVVRKIHKHVQTERPDVIHLHSSKMSVVGRFAHALGSHRSLLYYTPHGYAFLRQDVSSLHRQFYRSVERLSQSMWGGTVIACGKPEYRHARKLGPAQLVRNGINVKAVQSKKKATPHDRLTIGILGRITHARNPGLFDRIARSHPDIDFIWIGDGTLRHKLTAENITITGWFTDRSKGLDYLNHLDIYMQTSSWEGLPIAPLEAMAFQLPVMATAIEGNLDIVDDGKTGYLFTGIKSAGSAIQSLEDPQTRKEMGQAALKRLNRLFNADKNFNRLVDIYLDDLR